MRCYAMLCLCWILHECKDAMCRTNDKRKDRKEEPMQATEGKIKLKKKKKTRVHYSSSQKNRTIH